MTLRYPVLLEMNECPEYGILPMRVEGEGGRPRPIHASPPLFEGTKKIFFQEKPFFGLGSTTKVVQSISNALAFTSIRSSEEEYGGRDDYYANLWVTNVHDQMGGDSC